DPRERPLEFPDVLVNFFGWNLYQNSPAESRERVAAGQELVAVLPKKFCATFSGYDLLYVLMSAHVAKRFVRIAIRGNNHDTVFVYNGNPLGCPERHSCQPALDGVEIVGYGNHPR